MSSNESTISGIELGKGRRGFGALFACSVLVLSGCGNLGVDKNGHAQVGIAVPVVNVNVPNPLASHAVSLASHVEFDSTGLLKAGTYSVGKHSLVLAHDTPFSLKADVPMAEGARPDLAAGSADFTLMGAGTVDGVNMPRHIELKDHKASADVDVVGTLVSVVASRLPKPDDGDGGEAEARKLSTMLGQLTINSARVDLRTDREVDVSGAKLKFAQGSNLAFNNVQYFDADNFKGECTITISGKDVQATVGDGKLGVGTFKFGCGARVVCANDQLAITLTPGAEKPSLSFANVAVSHGNHKITLASGAVQPDTFDMNVRRHDWGHAAFVVAGKMQTKVSGGKGGTFGIPDFNAEVGSVGVELDDRQKRVSFGDLHVLLSSANLNSVVAAHLPKSKLVNVDKELVHQTPWRYKNLMIETVDVINPKIAGLNVSGKNAATLNCSATAKVVGTVEKEHPIGALLRRNGDEPDTKTWKANAVLGGPAAIRFTVAPGESLADAKINANVDFTLNRMDKVTVDWSGVSGSIAGKAEGAVIRLVMAALKKHVTTKGFAVTTSVSAPLFKHADERLKMLTLKSVAVKPAPGGTELVASGYIELR